MEQKIAGGSNEGHRYLHRRFVTADSYSYPGHPKTRYNSNPRPNSKTDISKLYIRVPLIELSRPKVIKYNKYENNAWICNQKSKLKYTFNNQKKFLDPYEKIDLNRIPDSQVDNESLIIESLCFVPKTKKLNPVREKLIKMFGNHDRNLWEKNSNHTIIHLVNPEYYRDDTPSPVIKPRYKH
jgi:hypothetical protein